MASRTVDPIRKCFLARGAHLDKKNGVPFASSYQHLMDVLNSTTA